MFIGSKNSGKSYGLVKMIKNYEEQPVKDSKGNILEIRTILFCPTGNSEANPIYTTLKSLDFSNDVILNYSDTKLIEKLNEIEKDFSRALLLLGECQKKHRNQYYAYRALEDIYTRNNLYKPLNDIRVNMAKIENDFE